jgi:glycosyltransferase involved in cell wall biosynthesis
MLPTISICIPAYKQPDNLRRLLESIEIQTYTDFEVIITDDSPDDCLVEVINNLSWSFSIQHYKNATALGSPGNWNSAISRANGKWVKLMHHDDWFEDEHSLQFFFDATLEHPAARFFYCETWIFDTKSLDKFIYKPNPEKDALFKSHPAVLFHANVIGAPTTTLIQKDAFQLYDTNLIWLVDIEHYIRSMEQLGIIKITKPLIVTSASQAHQLTTVLLNNKDVELREYFYCFNKFNQKFNHANRAIFAQKILLLLQQFNVKSVNEITSSGYFGPIPLFVKLYCLIASFSQVLASRILGKWIQLKLVKYDCYRTY